ncbi:MAG: response regulator [Anaplasmataceae bacterium]|nr:response regulator [Anaplasmataceae bacterium]
MSDPVKIKILSVEDDEFIRLFIKDVIWIHGADQNIEFEAVQNTNDAEKKINDQMSRPDILFLDLMLPKEDGEKPLLENGLSLLEKVKTNPDMMHIRVLVFSSVKDADIKEKVVRLGADRYMVKGDYLPTDIITAVKEEIAKLEHPAS